MEKRTSENNRALPRFLTLALSAGLFAALSGCVPFPRGVEGYSRGVDQDDFPVPARFDVVPHESWTYRTPGLSQPEGRSWRGTYRGTGTIDDVVPFYVREMPKLGWTLSHIKDKEPGKDRRALSFHKGDEEADVTLYRKYDSRLGGYAVIIEGDIRPRRLENFANESDIDPAQSGMPDGAPAIGQGGTETAPVSARAKESGTVAAAGNE